MNKNGQMWRTETGAEIQAHGGMILTHENRYYWYGENKAGPNITSSIGGRKVAFIGISCYSSADLIHWQEEGLVLEATQNPDEALHSSKIVERPKVIYNETTKQFVMWFHYDTDDYLYAACGVAVAESPVGPFRLTKIFQPNRKDCRDMTLFQERRQAYLIHSSDFNKTMYISELNDTYTDVTGLYTKILVDQEREAPALFKANGYYFLITSGTSGWAPNAALYSRSTHLFSPAKLIDNPCEGKDYRKTFNGQSSFVIEKEGQFYLLLDHWQPDKLRNSGYSLLPIIVNGRELTIPWQTNPLGYVESTERS